MLIFRVRSFTGMDYRNGHYAMTLGALNVFHLHYAMTLGALNVFYLHKMYFCSHMNNFYQIKFISVEQN